MAGRQGPWLTDCNEERLSSNLSLLSSPPLQEVGVGGGAVGGGAVGGGAVVNPAAQPWPALGTSHSVILLQVEQTNKQKQKRTAGLLGC